MLHKFDVDTFIPSHTSSFRFSDFSNTVRIYIIILIELYCFTIFRKHVSLILFIGNCPSLFSLVLLLLLRDCPKNASGFLSWFWECILTTEQIWFWVLISCVHHNQCNKCSKHYDLLLRLFKFKVKALWYKDEHDCHRQM